MDLCTQILLYPNVLTRILLKVPTDFIFFTAGDSDNKWNIRPYVLECLGSDPIKYPWEEKGKMQAAETDKKSFTY